MGDVIDLTGDGGVLKKIITHAIADVVASTNHLPLVDVHNEGTLAETGEVFDSTHEDNSIFSFEIGSGTVIKACDFAFRTMKGPEEDLKKHRELAATTKKEEKKKRETAKAAAARVQAKLDAKEK